MSLADYLAEPFRETNIQYENSCLSLGVQPEYATGDVLLGACYRGLHLLDVQESEVDLESVYELPEGLGKSQLQIEMWEYMFRKALRSPTRPGESSSRPLPQLVPIVPSLAQYSGVLGRRRQRWNAGRLAIYALASGNGPHRYAESILEFARAIDVVQHEDDQLAIFLEQQLATLTASQRRPIDADWAVPELNWTRVAYRDSVDDRMSPAEVLARDLREVLALKQSLTRRQWCALLESLLRLGLAMHVLWMCRLNNVVWHMVLEVLAGNETPSRAKIDGEIWPAHLGHGAFLDAGQSSDTYLKRQVEGYAIARLGINLVLHSLDDAGTAWSSPASDDHPLPAAEQLASLLGHVSQAMRQLHPNPRNWVMSRLDTVLDEQASKVSARSGSPKNLYEFLAHTLRRRPSKEASMNEHDQGYLLAKLPGPRNAPWVVRPGPVLLMAMCHSTYRSMRGAPVTLQHLARHFSLYGVRLSTGDLQEGEIARDLGALGVLVDSPDAGGGRLVLDPFGYGARTS